MVPMRDERTGTADLGRAAALRGLWRQAQPNDEQSAVMLLCCAGICVPLSKNRSVIALWIGENYER